MSLEKLFFAGFIVMAAMVALPFIAWWLYRWIRETKRTCKIRSVARRYGYEFRSRAPSKLKDLAHFRLFANDSVLFRRSGRRIRNLLTHRSDDIVTTVLDFEWRGCGDDEGPDPRIRRTVVHVTSDRLKLPEFDVRPNGLYLKLTSRFRSKIKMDANPEFAHRYDLSCTEEARIREWLHDDILELIAAEPRKLQFQGMGNELLFFPVDQKFFGEGRLEPEDIPQLLQFACRLCTQFRQPSHGIPIRSDALAGVGVTV